MSMVIENSNVSRKPASRKPKIALIYLGRRGGGPVYALEMAKALNEKAELLCVVSRQVENLSQWENAGLRILEVDTYTNFISFIFSTLKFWRFSKLANNIRSFKPDVVYYPMLHYWAPILNKFLKSVPKIVTVHDVKPHKGEESRVFQWMTHTSIRQADKVVILSEVFRKDLENMGIDSNSIVVIPHGEFSYYTQLGGMTGTAKMGRTILFFGRIHEYKGIGVLLEAFKRIKDEVPDAKLILAGSGDIGPYKNLLAGLKDVEIVNRWIPDNEVAQYFQVADLVVVPYIDASQSGVIPLAYSFGLPVVASRIGGIPEQVDDGKTGFLVEPGNAEVLAEKCTFLLMNRELLKEMGRRALEKSKTELSWSRAANKLIEVVLELSRENPSLL